MKVSAPHRGWTSGRATPSLRPNPYAAETANPAGRHLSFAEICPDDRGRLCWRAASSDQDDYPSGADRNQRLAILLCNRFIEKSASIHHPIQVTAERKRRIRRMVNRIPLEIVLLGSRRTPLHRTKALSSSESTVAIRCSTIRAFSGQSSAPGAGRRYFSPSSSKLFVARERTPNPDGPVRVRIREYRPAVARASRALTRSNGDKFPALGTW